MAELTNLESKLAEVLGLAAAAKGATEKVRGMLDDDEQDLAGKLERMGDEASETADRCTEFAAELDGKKTAIVEAARETKQEATEMMETYLEGQDEALDGIAALRKLTEWALPIQERHLNQVLASSLELAGRQDPSEPAE
jgi:hypothetical protein